MTDADKTKSSPDTDVLVPTRNPLVFISHDHTDADLAEAFGKLIKSVSAGVIKIFRSSDRKGTEGVDFGAEWYTWLMSKLQITTDVVCLFTERSLDRPWILFEAGVAKGKLDTPVIGLALGIPLKKVGTGPFYQFHNMDDSEAELTKLINQLARHAPNLELEADMVKMQVDIFRKTSAEVLKKLNTQKGSQEQAEDDPVTKLVEEMKALPSRVAERLAEAEDPFSRRRKLRRFHPMMFEEMMHMAGEPGDPVGILMVASMIRDDAPWLYELAMEVYRAVKSGDPSAIKTEITRLERFSEFSMRGPFMEEFGLGGKESHMLLRDFQRTLQHMLRRTLENKKPQTRRKTTRSQSASKEML